MSPEVEAAIIAAGVGILGFIGAVYGTRKTTITRPVTQPTVQAGDPALPPSSQRAPGPPRMLGTGL
jgi:hypothetical protein